MNANQQQSPEYLVGCIPLAAGDTLRVVDPRSMLVYVPQGRVWITEERVGDDIVLDAGGWHRLTHPGTAVIEAFSPAVLMLTSPHEAGFATELVTQPRPALPPDRLTTDGNPAAGGMLPAWHRPSEAIFRMATLFAGGTG